MRTHIEDARRLSAIEAGMHQDDDASSPVVQEDIKKQSTNEESVTRRSLPHDDATKSRAKVATAQDKVRNSFFPKW